VLAVGGKVIPLFKTNVPGRFLDVIYKTSLFGGYDRGDVRKSVEWIMGCNMCFRREAFDIVGYFDEDLGRKNGQLLSGEEVDFCLRIKDRGFEVIYEPRAFVYHKIPIDRLSNRWIIRRAFWEGVSQYILSRKHRARKEYSSDISGTLTSFRVDSGMLHTLCKLSSNLGIIAERYCKISK